MTAQADRLAEYEAIIAEAEATAAAEAEAEAISVAAADTVARIRQREPESTSAARLEENVAEYDDLLGGDITDDQRIKVLRARTETLMQLARLRGEDRLSFRQFLASGSWRKIETHLEWLLGHVDRPTIDEFRRRMMALDEEAKGVLKDPT